MKKGQMSLFIFIALVIIILTILLFTTTSHTTQREQDPITEFIRSCLEQAAIQATHEVAANGGDMHIPDNVPNIIHIQKQIEQKIPKHLMRCYNDFKAIKSAEVTAEVPNLKATIIHTYLLIDLEQTIESRTVDKITYYKNVQARIQTPLKDTIQTAATIQNSWSDLNPIINSDLNATFFIYNNTKYAVLTTEINREPLNWWLKLH